MPNTWDAFKSAFLVLPDEEVEATFNDLVQQLEHDALRPARAGLVAHGWDRVWHRRDERNDYLPRLADLESDFAACCDSAGPDPASFHLQLATLRDIGDRAIQLANDIARKVDDCHTIIREFRLNVLGDHTNMLDGMLDRGDVALLPAVVETLADLQQRRTDILLRFPEDDVDASYGLVRTFSDDLRAFEDALGRTDEVNQHVPRLASGFRGITADFDLALVDGYADLADRVDTLERQLADGDFAQMEPTAPTSAIARDLATLNDRVRSTAKARSDYQARLDALVQEAAELEQVARFEAPLTPTLQAVRDARDTARQVHIQGHWTAPEAPQALDAFQAALRPLAEQVAVVERWDRIRRPHDDLLREARTIQAPAFFNDTLKDAVEAFQAADAALRQAVDNGDYAGAEVLLRAAVNAANTVMQVNVAQTIDLDRDLYPQLEQVGSQLGEQALHGLCHAYITTDALNGVDGAERIQIAVIEATFGVDVDRKDSRKGTRWKARPGGPKKGTRTLEALYQALADALLAPQLKALRKRSKATNKRAAKVSALVDTGTALVTAVEDLRTMRQNDRSAEALAELPTVTQQADDLDAQLRRHDALQAAMKALKGTRKRAEKLMRKVLPGQSTSFDDARTAVIAARTELDTGLADGAWSEAEVALEAWRSALTDLLTEGELVRLRGKRDPGSGIQKLASLDNGEELIDRLVHRLDPTNPGDAPIARAALEHRFHIKVQQFDQHKREVLPGVEREDRGQDNRDRDTASLKAMFEILGRVPTSHVHGNKRLKKVVLFGEDDGAAHYSPSNNEVVMYCGRAEGSEGFDDSLASPTAFPDGIDPECRPVPSEANTVFSWFALHEVAHAVDARLNLMESKKGVADYGDWQTHSVSDIARLVSRDPSMHPKLEGFLAKVLNGKTPDAPRRPRRNFAGTDNDWTRLVDQARAWALDGREDVGPWSDGKRARERAIGGRVYHQAYAHRWVSYPLDTRQQGIRGYQFRSGAEWFAELYAAFHSGVMQQGHPFRDKLEALDAPG